VFVPGLIAGSSARLRLCAGRADHAELGGGDGQGSSAEKAAAMLVDGFGCSDLIHGALLGSIVGGEVRRRCCRLPANDGANDIEIGKVRAARQLAIPS